MQIFEQKSASHPSFFLSFATKNNNFGIILAIFDVPKEEKNCIFGIFVIR